MMKFENTPTFSNLVILHTYQTMKIEECSETSAYKIKKPGNYPEESIQRMWIRFPTGVRDFCVLKCVLNCSWSYPASYSISKELFCYLQGDCGVKLFTHFHLVSRLKIRGTVPPLPYAFRSWSLLKDGKKYA